MASLYSNKDKNSGHFSLNYDSNFLFNQTDKLFLLMKTVNNNIILIGPLATGKSTIAAKLSGISGLLNHPVDKLKWYYRFKNGYDLHTSTKILKKQGFEELIKYVQQYFGPDELRAILYEFAGIIDLGATDSYCTDVFHLRKLKKIFNNFPNVFLILPSPSEEISVKILNDRLTRRYENDSLKAPVMNSYIEMNKKFIASEFNKQIANHTIYTEGKTIEMLANELLNKSKFINYERAAAIL